MPAVLVELEGCEMIFTTYGGIYLRNLVNSSMYLQVGHVDVQYHLGHEGFQAATVRHTGQVVIIYSSRYNNVSLKLQQTIISHM